MAWKIQQVFHAVFYPSNSSSNPPSISSCFHLLRFLSFFSNICLILLLSSSEGQSSGISYSSASTNLLLHLFLHFFVFFSCSSCTSSHIIRFHPSCSNMSPPIFSSTEHSHIQSIVISSFILLTLAFPLLFPLNVLLYCLC